MSSDISNYYLENQNMLKQIKIEDLEKENKQLIECVKFYGTIGRFSNAVGHKARFLLQNLKIEIPVYDKELK